MNIDRSTDMTDLILALGYFEVREMFKEEIEEERQEGYEKGKKDAQEEMDG